MLLDFEASNAKLGGARFSWKPGCEATSYYQVRHITNPGTISEDIKIIGANFYSTSSSSEGTLCSQSINPEYQLRDDNLEVLTKFSSVETYCVTSVIENENKTASYSSTPSCSSIKIEWKGDVSGKVLEDEGNLNFNFNYNFNF